MLWSPLLCYILTISESIFHHSDDDNEDDEVDEVEEVEDDDTENMLKYLWSSPQNTLSLADEFDLCKR